MEKDLTLDELQAALKQLKAMKSCPDGITNEILTQLGYGRKAKLQKYTPSVGQMEISTDLKRNNHDSNPQVW